jgi:hypothetical protein
LQQQFHFSANNHNWGVGRWLFAGQPAQSVCTSSARQGPIIAFTCQLLISTHLPIQACKEDWLNYLRFSLVLPPSSPVGRLLSQVAGFGGYSEAIWKHLYRVSKHFGADAGVAEHNDIRNCLTSLTPQGQAGDQRCTTNLHIGEVMLQLSKSGPSSVGRSDPEGKLQVSSFYWLNQTVIPIKVFVPFLAELLTGSNIGTASSSDPSFPSFNFIRQATLGEEQQQRHATTEMVLIKNIFQKIDNTSFCT